MPSKNEDQAACQAEACSLQTCLNSNTYKPERCDRQLRQLYECCDAMYAKDANMESTACPTQRVVQRWLKRQGS
ncbi:hypothetical protein BOTBODRAFT_38929 [Botryobasidium botryosum FD-172 SS1]|uniref:Cx9C motif-containing protein 4, mitochondrial n=1 Tax=Botryobasidium botryosum (strain FD-172 SS1) TaxID=930990 RepID=A0A067M6Z2_BOTB1|nr:hypothetical protein BOTBODRAFT_38929 [Botryobasidium botryosum FD-172 SS1]